MRRLLVAAAAPVVAALSVRPLADRIATRLMAAPRRLPEEAGMAPALDALGGEVVRLRARDGVRLTGRWLAADPGVASAAGDDAVPDGRPAWTPDPREAILLLHGWSGSATPDLVELGPFLRRTAGVLGLDHRGHGGSDDGPTTFGLLEVEDVAGALAWMGERGISRVALVGSSMGGITAIAAVAVLGDGRLPSADLDPAAPVSPAPPPRPRIVAVVAESVSPELEPLIARRIGRPLGRLLAGRAFGRMARRVGGDPRLTQPIAMIGLLEDMPLLLVHGADDRLVPVADGRRLVAAAPPGTRHLVIEGAGHGAAHAVNPAGYEAAVGSLLREAFAAARA
jgi:pimeloyl-ACP methyl ester carboxylesterase